MKKRSNSSNIWLARQNNDPYTKLAKQQGYRSRAVYKLLEIQQKDKIFYKGAKVLDLGAAPGGWSQLAVEYVGELGKVIALDLLPIEPISGVDIIQGDFTDDKTIEQLSNILLNTKFDLIICDMAPNFSGISDTDQFRAVYLSEMVLDFAVKTLKQNGTMLIKLFQGSGFDKYMNDLKKCFTSVVIRKPKASHSESREVYALAKKLKITTIED
jgi:23S rRNA (uridine2552-2'-O)-methyltransferase